MRRILLAASLLLLLSPAVTTASFDTEVDAFPARMGCVEHYEYGQTPVDVGVHCAVYIACDAILKGQVC